MKKNTAKNTNFLDEFQTQSNSKPQQKGGGSGFNLARGLLFSNTYIFILLLSIVTTIFYSIGFSILNSTTSLLLWCFTIIFAIILKITKQLKKK